MSIEQVPHARISTPSQLSTDDRPVHPVHPVHPVPETGAGPGGSLLQAVRDTMISLRAAQDGLNQPEEAEEALSAVVDELNLLEEELSAQLGEIDEALRARSQERGLLQRMVSALPIPLITTDAHGAVRHANAAAADLLGVPAWELPHKPLLSYVAGPDRPAIRRVLASALQSDAAVDAAAVLTPRRGRPVSCRLALTRLVSATGAGTGPAASGPGSMAEVADRVAPNLPELSWVIQAPEPAHRPAGAGPGFEPGPASGSNLDLARYRATLTELCRIAATDTDLNGLLRRVAELAAEGLPGVDAVSVVIGPPSRPSVLASSSALAQTADGLQHLAGAGPAFDAFTTVRPVFTTDPADPRWPALRRRRGAGRGSAAQVWLALPIVVADSAAGVVMLYGRDRAAFGLPAAAQAAPYVAAAGALVRDRSALAELVRVRDELQDALASRAIIDQAKGMIMLTRHCGAEEAFALLVRMSSLSNRKIRDLAREFVEEVASGRPGPHLP